MDTREERLASISHILNDVRIELRQVIDKLQDIAYETSGLNGWHDKPRPISEVLMLFVTEIAEIYEHVRDGDLSTDDMTFTPADQSKGETMDKPEGIVIELADLIIRILDAAEEWHLDLGNAVVTKMIYNTTRSYRHGGKTA